MDYTYAPIAAALSTSIDEASPSAPSGSAASPGVIAEAAASMPAHIADAIAPNTTITPAVAMAAQQAEQDSRMTAWVVCAWQLANITDFQKMTRDWDASRIR